MDTHAYIQNIEESGECSKKIVLVIPWNDIIPFELKVLKEVSKEMEVDGFRKGNVPEMLVRQKLGLKLSEYSTEELLKYIFPDLLQSTGLKVIGYPQTVITKLAERNPVEVSIFVFTEPEIILGDYITIAKEVFREPIKEEVTEEEIQDALLLIRQDFAKYSAYEKAYADAVTDEERKSLSPQSMTVSDDNLPELTDDFVKMLGEYETADAFIQKFKEDFAANKKQKLSEGRYIEVLEKIAAASTFKIPKPLIEAQLDEMIHQFGADVERMNMTLKDYLEHSNKKLEDLRAEWVNEARKRVEADSILQEIAQKETSQATEEEIHAELEKLMVYHKDIDEYRARLYISSVVSNRKTLTRLEEIGSSK